MKNYKFNGDQEQFVSQRTEGKTDLRNFQLKKLLLIHVITKEKKIDVDKLKKMFDDD